MFNKVCCVVISIHIFGILMTILSLSLDYWQGNRLTVDAIYKTPLEESRIMKTIIQIPPSMGSMENLDTSDYTDNAYSYDPSSRFLVAFLRTKFTIHTGLWRFCVADVYLPNSAAIFLPRICMDIENDWVKGNVDAVRAMLLMGLFVLVAGLVATVMKYTVVEEKRFLLPLASGLDFLAGFFLMVGFSCYAGAMKINRLSLQSGFYLCIVAWLSAWISAIVLVTTRIANTDLPVV